MVRFISSFTFHCNNASQMKSENDMQDSKLYSRFGNHALHLALQSSYRAVDLRQYC